MVIKALNIENPFADYGNIVEGNRFVGRKSEIAIIHSRVLGTNYGNLAIMGLPRVGKSSLARNALVIKRSELSKRKILVESINIGTIFNVKDFYLKLMEKALCDIKILDEELYHQIQPLRISYQNLSNQDNIEFFFALIKQRDYRLIYVLDEFDNVVNLLKLQDFQFLRELSISPETRICLVTISRRTIQELEPDNGAISNFYGVFSDLNLRLFNEVDLVAYWQRTEELGINFEERYKNEVHYFVGNHPYWLDMINYHIFNGLQASKKNSLDILSEVGSELKKSLWDSYDGVLGLMEKESLKSHFIQAVVGPVLNLTQMSIERLTKYDLIKPISARYKYGSYFQVLLDADLVNEEDISYKSISAHFDDYLKQKETEFDIWTLWSEAEHQVRELIIIYLREKHGKDWRDSFIAKNPRQEQNIIKMEQLRDENKRKFGLLASDDLVRYTYPLDMWNIFIVSDWAWFQKIFNTDKKQDWQAKFYLLGKVRNPIAHSNRDFVLEDEQRKAKEICGELIKRIETWKNK